MKPEEIRVGVTRWALERELYEKSTMKDQLIKLVEEVGELARAINEDQQLEEVEKEIGDCVVVLTNLANMRGTDLFYCYERAYLKIKHRNGSIKNGTFVRERHHG